MALPTAQLGSLSSINLPTYGQNPSYRPVSPWVQAFASILANAGSAAGDKLVSNELSGDNASEFGRKDATGWDRLLHGPAVDDRAAMQLRGQAGDREQLAAQDQFAQEREAQRQAAELERTKTTERGATERNRQTNATSAEDLANRMNMELASTDRTQGGADARLQQELAAKRPLNDAQIAEAQAVARYHNSQAALQDKTTALIPNPPTAPGSGPVNPNIAKFASGQSGAVSGGGVVPGSDTRSDAEIIQSYLDQGVPEQQVSGMMQSAAAKQAQTQDVARVMGGLDEQKAAQRQAAVQRIMQQLHPEMYQMRPYGGGQL